MLHVGLKINIGTHGWERSALRNIEITYTTILYTRSRKKIKNLQRVSKLSQCGTLNKQSF